MRYTFGYTDPTTIEVTNRQQCVEYKVIYGFTDERDARAAAGNYGKSTYAYCFTGWCGDRKQAIKRLESDIKEAREHLEKLEFSLKVTKKKNWVRVD